MASNNIYRGVKCIMFAGILCLTSFNMQAQIQHKQLRYDILEESQMPKQAPVQEKKKVPTRRTPVVKPLEALPPVAPIRTPYDQKNAKIIYLENADLVSFDQLAKPDVQTLIGKVKFRHDDATLTCDSAYFYQNTNSLDAFSNVTIVQGDTLFVYGDKLYYDGNTKFARLRGKARLLNSNTVLTTDSLNYDRTTQLAYYFTGGKIVDKENTLTSVWGQYSTATEDALFRSEVKLVNEKFVMNSDTLKYNSKTHIANLVGDTHILYEDETDIYTNKGWYNTNSERSMLLNRSFIVNKEGKSITGDTIFYDKTIKYGEIFGKAILNDTVQKTTLYGNYVYYNEETELGIATDSALLVDWSDEKNLYIHADTLQTIKDSIYTEAKAWRNVRFYREDIQGVSDSLIFSSRDSIIHLFNEPVLWQEKQQYSSNIIRVLTKNQEVDQVQLQQSAMSVELVDSLFFNQLSGKDIIAYVDSGELRRVEVNGNAETIYFVRDDADTTLVGANRTESSFVKMHFLNKKIDRIILTPASSGTFYPIEMVSDDVIYLTDFFWLEAQRPLNKDEVFSRFPKGERPKFLMRSKEPIVTPQIDNDSGDISTPPTLER
ncbi:MAG: OstA-like protein [Paludibacter sp.]|nr:OstA-like protein [Paludibacter sp.]